MPKTFQRFTEAVTDQEIRNLVLHRLEALSSDTIKSIGDEGVYTKKELIEHVRSGDRIGLIIADVEMEWLQSLKHGILSELYAGQA